MSRKEHLGRCGEAGFGKKTVWGAVSEYRTAGCSPGWRQDLGAQPSLLTASVTMATSHKSASVLPCQMGKIVLNVRIR